MDRALERNSLRATRRARHGQASRVGPSGLLPAAFGAVAPGGGGFARALHQAAAATETHRCGVFRFCTHAGEPIPKRFAGQGLTERSGSVKVRAMSHLLLAYVLASALDVETTCLALSHGGYERNILAPQTCGRMVLVRSGITAGATVGLWSAAKTHPTAARWVTVGLIGVTSVVVAQNMRVLHHLGRSDVGSR